jgi:hypothetical protein
MSDVMLLGVLEMPPELWGPDEGPINDARQRYSRYLEAAQRIRDDAAEIERLRGEVASLKDRIHNANNAYATLWREAGP